ncbi:copper amine oxidase [Cohnella pontilimi]|uniref:Copper amine oxidase n=1 Tax=Cohnella pontilimi TaxID=2564100 RepID=A0A4U0FET5_9BACL|nr:copper amine oxidase [Cohnella pontilimi]TJY43310.1 copper amine oxidase [Cohnella pontilimi]
MKWKKIATMTLVLTLVCGTAVFAESVSDNVRIVINKKELDDAGLIVDNKAYLAVSKFAGAMQAMLTWDNDTKKVTIYKPNVHMLTMKDSVPFQSVPKDKYKFFVYAQIDSLKTSISAFKITITDPYGEATLIDARDSSDKNFPSDMDIFGIKTKDFTYDFKYAGTYVVRFLMKQDDGSGYQVVSEKVITAK